MANMAMNLTGAPPVSQGPGETNFGLGHMLSNLASSAFHSAPRTPTAPPKPPALPKVDPIYKGGHIASVPHVANLLGSDYKYNPGSGLGVLVNGTKIKPTSIHNGVPHAPVHEVAMAAGHPSSLVKQVGNQTHIMPQQTAPTTPGTSTTPAQPAPAQPQVQQTPVAQQYIQQLMGQMQPFQFNQQQAFQNDFNALAPTFQQQQQLADERINEQMNNRGLATSGLAQQAVSQNDQAYLDRETAAANKQVNADQSNAMKAWQDNNSNILSILGKTLPYVSPNAYQQGELNLNYLKTMLPYQMMTANQAATLGLDRQKLQAQIAQNSVLDQQKWASIMGVGPDGQPTLDAQKLTATIQNDAQKAYQASVNSSNNQVKTQLSGLHDQLVAAGTYITNLNASGQFNTVDPSTGQTYGMEAMANYNNVNAAISLLEQQAGSGSGN